MKTKQQFKDTIKKGSTVYQVGIILSKYKNARNDDNDLWERLIMYFYPNAITIKAFISFSALRSLPSHKTISRHRALYQGTYNMFLPTDPDVLHKRRLMTDQVMMELGYTQA